MKKQLTVIALLLVSLSSFSQKKAPSGSFYPEGGTNPISKQICACVYDDSTHRAMGMVLTETQLTAFFQLFELAKAGFYESDAPGRQIKSLSIFADSCKASWSAQYQKWHPAPPLPQPAVKKDSAQNK